MTGVGGDTGRGVRVAARSLRTWRRMVELAVVAALVVALIAAVWRTSSETSSHDWHVMGVYALCEFLLVAGFDPNKSKKIRDVDGRVYVNSIGRMVAFEPIVALRDRILGEALTAASIGFGGCIAVVAGCLVALRIMGGRLRRGRRLRGGELATARELARRARPLHRRAGRLFRRDDAGPCEIAGIPWPNGAETRHTIVSGTTGAGKTVLIADLVEQIRARGERCVLYDKMGSYTETFFDLTRDVLLNPLDDRSPRWSPFLEARSARDFDTMAAALIPRQKDAADPFWITAARQLFSHGAAVLWQRGETGNKVLIDHLLKTELSALAEAMEGTVAQSIVDPANPKTALSVRAMLTANIGTMDLLSDEGPPFSIREWIEREGQGGFLFLTSRGDQHASLRGLISTWLEIAVNALLSLPREDGRRIWVILDELPTLHQLPSLRPGLAESRQFGGCFVLGVQVFSALRDLYGRDGAETISGLCGTRVVLAAPDRDTSEWSAESLGRAEMESLAEGVSYDTPRDGVTLSARRDLRSLILPAEVARLENLSGYLKFPGAWPVARIQLKYRARPTVADRFVPRVEGEGGPGRDAGMEWNDAGDRLRAGESTRSAVPGAAACSDPPAFAGRSAGDGADGSREPLDDAAEAIQGELEFSCSVEAEDEDRETDAISTAAGNDVEDGGTREDTVRQARGKQDDPEQPPCSPVHPGNGNNASIKAGRSEDRERPPPEDHPAGAASKVRNAEHITPGAAGRSNERTPPAGRSHGPRKRSRGSGQDFY